MTRDLSRLLAPRSIAVIGGGAWCANVIGAARKFGFDGAIWPVHPARETVAGLPAYSSVGALPGAPDAAFVGVNHGATVEVIAALAARGAGGAVAFASGFGEVEAAEGAARQALLVAAAGNMPVLGPNCYGMVNALDRVALWPDEHGLVPVSSGVAIVTQSSNIAINLTMQRRGLPIAAVVTAGNQAQIGLAEIGAALIADPRITALGLHVEGVGDVAAFERMARAAAASGKPVVVLKAGRSAAAQAATVSHTASLAGSSAGASALFARLGCAEALGLAEFLEALKLVHVAGPMPGGVLASMSCSGGEASLIADAVDRVGTLSWAPLTGTQRGDLGAVLGPKVTIANPLDYHTYIWNDVPAMAAAFGAMLRGPQDLTLLVADFPREDRADPAAWACLIEAAIRARAETGARLALISTLPETMPEAHVARLAEAGVVALSGLEEGLRAIRLAITPGLARAVTAAPVAALPPAPVAVALVPEDAAKAWLGAAGIDVPQGARAETADAAMQAFVKSPSVLKGLGHAHKTEAGAVVLGLDSPGAVARAAARIGAGPYLLEEQVTGGVAELLLGVVRDPAHGWVMTLGAGGVLTEIWRDTVSLLLPATGDEIRAALMSLRIAPLLTGYRGKPPGDIAAVVHAALAVQDAVLSEAARIEEVEINPLIVTADRAVAADALIRMGEAPE